MTALPDSLNFGLNPVDILDRLGSEVKTGVPRHCDCPLCHKGELRVYENDPVAAFWLYCPACGFSGDGIHLFAAARGLEVGTAVRRMLREGVFPPEFSVTEFEIDRYVARISEPWHIFQEFVNRSLQAYVGTNISRSFASLLRRYGLWCGYGTADRPQRMAQLIGGSTRSALKGLPASTEAALHSTTYRGGVGSVLIIPSFDLPGRPRAVYVLAEGGQAIKELNVRPGGSPGYSDHGLAFLGTVGDAEIVYAVRDPVFAMHLQAANFLIREDPLPIVVWTERTNFAWTNLRNRTVVFWQPFVDAHVFKAALRFPNARLSFAPILPFRPTVCQIESYVSGIHPSDFLKTVNQSARSVYEALAAEIEKDRGGAINLIEGVGLSERQENMLLECCKPKEQERVREILNVGRTGQPFVFEGAVIIETDGGLFEQRAGAGLGEQIADVQIIPELNFRYTETDRTYLSGHVLIGAERVYFWENRAIIAKDPAGWVEKLLMDAGYAQPVIHSRYRKKLLQLALARHRPPTARALERVGWDEEGQLMLPRVKVYDGKVEQQVGARVPTPSAQPGHTIEHVSSVPPALFRQTVRQEETVAFFWAFTAALLRNLLAPRLGWQPVLVGVGGDAKKGGALEQMAEAYGLETAEFRRNTLTESRHQLPRLLRVAPRRQTLLHNLIADRKAAALFFPFRDTTMQIASLHRSVIFLGRMRGPVNAKLLNGMANLLPHYLAWLQADAFVLPAADEPIFRILRSISDWLKLHSPLDLVDPAIEAATEMVLYTPAYPSERNLGEAFLRVCLSLQNHHALDIGKDADENLIIDLRAIGRLAKTLQFPPPPIEEVVESLTLSNRVRSVTDKTLIVVPG